MSDQAAEQFSTKGVAVIERLVRPAVAAHLASVLAIMDRAHLLQPDQSQVPGSKTIYGDPAFDTLLELLRDRLSDTAGTGLVPTYSFARVYFRDQELTPHRDRPECQYSVTIHLGASEDVEWPIELVDLEGSALRVSLGPGDGLLYLGCDVPHWRRPCPTAWYAQVFLHFVDPSSGALAFDGRPALGLPATTRHQDAEDPPPSGNEWPAADAH